MPGKRITQRQESLYMSTRQSGKSQETAAAKAAISERSGRRIEQGERQSISRERQWRSPGIDGRSPFSILRPERSEIAALAAAVSWLFPDLRVLIYKFS